MTENEKLLIINLWNSGQPIKSIIQMLPHDELTSKNMINQLKNDGVLTKRKKENKSLTREQLLNAYNNGITNPYKLAEMYNLSYFTVKNHLWKLNLNRTRPSKNYKQRLQIDIEDLSDTTKLIIEELKQGNNASVISQKHNVSRQWVYKVYHKYIKKAGN